MQLRAVLFDVDFTLAKPGPDLGPEGYVKLGRKYGLELDPDATRRRAPAAVAQIERHPELRHDEEMWFAFTELIVRGMGGDAPAARELAVEMTKLWERSENFDLYDDALPVLEQLRGLGLKLGLVSNGGREIADFVVHHALEVDCAIASRAHGWIKPHESIFRAALELLERGRRRDGHGRRLRRGRHRGRGRGRDRAPSSSTGRIATRTNRTACGTSGRCPRCPGSTARSRDSPPAGPGRTMGGL